MASSSSTTSVDPKPFPLQLCQGVLQDLLIKELDLHFSATDELKNAALQGAKESLPRRMHLIKSQIAASSPAGLADGFYSLSSELFAFLCEHPQVASIRPSMLEPSVFLDSLHEVLQAICSASASEKLRLTNGGLIVTGALEGIARAKHGLTKDKLARLARLLVWWGDKLACKRWGVSDAWGLFTRKEGAILRSPLHLTAMDGLADFAFLALARGCPANGSFSSSSVESPAALALCGGHLDVFNLLLAHGLDLVKPYEDGRPLVLSLISCKAIRAPLLADLVRRQPAIAHACTSQKASHRYNLLEIAIVSGDDEIVDVALCAGAPVEYRYHRFEAGGQVTVVQSSLAVALRVGSLNIIKLLITKGKVLEGWRHKYDRAALTDITRALARLALSGYSSYKGHSTDCRTHNPQAMEAVELVLHSGIVCEPNGSGDRGILTFLYPERQGHSQGCVLDEKDALHLLKWFHRAGFDVMVWGREVGSHAAVKLPIIAACAGHQVVLEWCIEVLKEPADPLEGTITPLTEAIRCKQIPIIALLLEKYRVKAAFSERPLMKQPIVVLMLVINTYTDAEATRVLSALIERDIALLDMPCFSERSVTELLAKEQAASSEQLKASPGSRVITAGNPVLKLAARGMQQALQVLLSSGMSGVAAMVHWPVPVPMSGETARLSFTAAQYAANFKKWECLGVLLRHTDARVTDPANADFPSVAEAIKRTTGKPNGPPRELIALVQARAKIELADKAKTAAASQAAGAITNAFEDPCFKTPTGKAKVKKTAAKKRNKKKKKATVAHAGAGAAAAPDSSDDDEEEEEEGEPDDNLVDSRNAPSVDVMFAAMGLGPGGAPLK